MLGNFVGSMAASLTYEVGYKQAISFCIDSGFTLFGLVEQNYELLDEVLEEVGIEVFRPEKFEIEKCEFETCPIEYFVPETGINEGAVSCTFLRRGVIGINRIGYVY